METTEPELSRGFRFSGRVYNKLDFKVKQVLCKNLVQRAIGNDRKTTIWLFTGDSQNG